MINRENGNSAKITLGCSAPAVHAIAGAIGGGLSLLITYPLCLLSMRTQFSQSQASSSATQSELPVPSVSSEAHNRKIRAILQRFEHRLVKLLLAIQKWYAGVSSAILAQLVIQYAYYYAYTYLRRLLASHKSLHSVFVDITSATIAGLCGATASQPLWVINTKKSIDAGAHSTISVLFETLRKDGVRVLFNGLLPSYILVLNPVISYSIFEGLKRYLLSARPTLAAAASTNPVAQLSGAEIFFLSALGKIASTLITYPYMVARNVMQYGKTSTEGAGGAGKRVEEAAPAGGASISLVGAWRHIIAIHGYKGLYRGLESKIVQSVMNHSLLFLFQDYICHALSGVLRPVR